MLSTATADEPASVYSPLCLGLGASALALVDADRRLARPTNRGLR